MRCRLCARLCARLWEESDAWERAHSNASELWWEEPLRSRELYDRAYAIWETDPAAAFRLFLEAAEAGSTWAMEAVGWHYWTGTLVAADLGKAMEYYDRAIRAGSWMATLAYARLLAEQGRHDESEQMLEDGVKADFVPAFFELARARYNRCSSRETRREIRPLLEHAADRGHPAARAFLGQLLIFGKYGLRGIAESFRMPGRWDRADEARRQDEAAPAVAAPDRSADFRLGHANAVMSR